MDFRSSPGPKRGIKCVRICPLCVERESRTPRGVQQSRGWGINGMRPRGKSCRGKKQLVGHACVPSRGEYSLASFINGLY